MATTASPTTERFLRTTNDLVTLATADLTEFWRALDRSDAVATRDAVLRFLPGLVQQYGEIGAALAADFYDDFRTEAPQARGSYRAFMPDVEIPVEQTAAGARWALGSLFGPSDVAAGDAAALTNLSGVTKRLILTPARDTVIENAVADPAAGGWRRVARGAETCKFCRMLVDRGNVYTEETAAFSAHDDCDCAAEPAFGDVTPVTAGPYIASKRHKTEADKIRLKEYLLRYED
jgi:hypothetical protein